MQIHCPNCKNTSEAIKNPSGITVWVMAYSQIALGAIVTAFGISSKDPATAALLVFAAAPMSFAAFGFILWWAKRVIYIDNSARCPICRYPWGVPVTHAPTANKPPLMK